MMETKLVYVYVAYALSVGLVFGALLGAVVT